MKTTEIEREIKRSLSEHYGLAGDLSRLPGENFNFRLTLPEGDDFIVKIVDDDMPESVVRMENGLIEHACDAGFPFQLPRIIRNLNRHLETRISLPGIAFNRLRLITFIDGEQLIDSADISIKTAEQLGWMMARFQESLKNFDDEAAHRDHRWNLASAGRHRDKIRLFKSEENRALLRWAFDQWSRAASELPTLEHQVIHGDMHDENVLVRGETIVGLIDFGDVCYNPTICDLGVCLPYLMAGRTYPFDIARAIVEGYDGVRSLSEVERSVLPGLLCGRLAVTLCVSRKRESIAAGNSHWHASAGPALELLNQLRMLDKRRRNALFL